VCGEPCSICVSCAPPDRRKDIVDLIMQTTMEDIVPGDTLDSLIFTLSCGHSFTVETLDGVCQLEEFYIRHDDKWHGLATPDPGFRVSPLCPTCRSPISIPRYGRAIRRSVLDLAELNVAADMSRALEEVRKTLNGFDQAKAQTVVEQAIVDAAPEATAMSPKDKANIQKLYPKYLQENPHRPIAAQILSLAGGSKKKNVHLVPRRLAMIWKNVTTSLNRAYSTAIEVATQRPAHLVAYENAFSTLYQQEMEAFTNDTVHTPRRPTENAMRLARFKVGQPPPRADKRFR
jgi:hypothetical protein